METQRENPTSDPDAWASITCNELLSEHRKDETEKSALSIGRVSDQWKLREKVRPRIQIPGHR